LQQTKQNQHKTADAIYTVTVACLTAQNANIINAMVTVMALSDYGPLNSEHNK